MAWVKIDDHFTDHPKMVQAGVFGRDLYLAALCYANRQLTDGFVPAGMVPRLADPDGPSAVELADRLVSLGLWEPMPGGYQIHDYFDYQPTKEKVLELRRVRSKAGAMGGRRSRQAQPEQTESKPPTKQEANHEANGQAKSNPVPVPVPGPGPMPGPGPVPRSGGGIPRTPSSAPPAEPGDAGGAGAGPPKTRKPPDPRVRPVIDAWCRRFGEEMSWPYRVVGKRDGAAIRSLPAQYGVAEIEALIDAFWRSDDRFVRESNPTIPVFVSVIGKLQRGGVNGLARAPDASDTAADRAMADLQRLRREGRVP